MRETLPASAGNPKFETRSSRQCSNAQNLNSTDRKARGSEGLIRAALIAVLLSAGLSTCLAATDLPIPSTYKSGHPRLPCPDREYLLRLASNPTQLAKYNAIADRWDSANPSYILPEFRHLLLAYMVSKAKGTPNLTYLNKIKQLADLGGTWGQLLYSNNDGIGNGTYTLKSSTAKFLTGRGGNSFKGYLLSLQGRLYWINNVLDEQTVVLSPSNPPPTGSGLKIRIFGNYYGLAALRIAMAYDWIYDDLDAATRTEFMNQLEVQATLWEEYYIGVGASPYNDVMYLRMAPDGLIAALAIYPDYDTANPTNKRGTYHLQFMMDKWFNAMLPVWKQVFGPEGGGWHEDWSYLNGASGLGLTRWLVPSLLSWQVASGEPLFSREAWLKNFAYYTMYLCRPDFNLERIGDSAHGYLMSEYTLTYNVGAGLGSLCGLAEIYDDPVLRGWARLVNAELPAGPDDFEPSAWPFYAPDTKAKPVSTRGPLPLSRNFPGWGVVFARSGWGEDDTFVTLKYGDNFWSHEHFDTGAFTIYHRGSLAIDSGAYRPGSASPHVMQYAKQTIAHNTLTITDPSDVYPTEKFSMAGPSGAVKLPLANDGGQRRVGSPFGELFPEMSYLSTLADWQARYDYYHMGSLLSFAAKPEYTYAAIDITPAYNNKYSATTPNSINRTQRADSIVRHMLFIPPGYVVIYDQITATKPEFKKRWLLHSINQPQLSGNRYEIRRTELAIQKPYNWTGPFAGELKHVNAGKYQYNGKLVGWMVQPQGAINVVGGPGKEFWIEDPKTPGSGTNWNQAMAGQAQGDWAFLAPNTPDLLSPSSAYAPVEPGSWRIEQVPGTPQKQDWFLNVMVAADADDTSIPATVTAITQESILGASWSDKDNSYEVLFPRTGIGGHLIIRGLKNVDTNLTQLPAISSFVATPDELFAGDSTTLSWSVSDATTLKLDQNIGSVLGTNWKTVSPAVTTTYTLEASNSLGTVRATATVLVSQPTAPSIVTQPQSVTVREGQLASFVVLAEGTAPLSYQWQRNSADIPGANQPGYTTPATALADDGALFGCRVSNRAGALASAMAVLRVQEITTGTVGDDGGDGGDGADGTGAGGGATPATLTLKALRISLDLKEDNNDSLQLQGSVLGLEAPWAGKSVTLSVGSFSTTLVLDARGNGKAARENIRLSTKKARKSQAAQTIIKYKASAKALAPALKALGLELGAKGAVQLAVGLSLDGQLFSGTAALQYSANKNRALLLMQR